MKEIKKGVWEKLLPKGKEKEEVMMFKKEMAKKEKEERIRKLESEFGFKVKTKVAQGPNPLAAKKKKIRDEVPPQHTTPQNESEPAKPKRKRIRKRNRGNKSQ